MVVNSELVVVNSILMGVNCESYCCFRGGIGLEDVLPPPKPCHIFLLAVASLFWLAERPWW
jgi:hypothetical protein